MKCINDYFYYDEEQKPEFSRGYTIEKNLLRCQQN